MTLAKAGVKANSNTKHIYSTGIKYDRLLRSSKYFYSTVFMMIIIYNCHIFIVEVTSVVLSFYKHILLMYIEGKAAPQPIICD